MSTTKPAYINRAKFAAALQSGEYKQVTGAYSQADMFCFFGLGFHIFGIKNQDAYVEEQQLLDLLDMSVDEGNRMMRLNDSGKTFQELGSRLLKLPYESEERNKEYFP